MFANRKRLGDFVPLGVQCKTPGNLRKPATPDAAPQITVYDSSGNVTVAARPMPAWGSASATGLFGFDEFLGSAYAVGQYCAYVTYSVSSTAMADMILFAVIDGGDANGAYTSLGWYDRPEAKYLIGNLEGGTLEYRSNPSV